MRILYICSIKRSIPSPAIFRPTLYGALRSSSDSRCESELATYTIENIGIIILKRPLRYLEGAGLAVVDREPGRTPQVTPLWRHLVDPVTWGEQTHERYERSLNVLAGEVARGEQSAYLTLYCDPPWQYSNSRTKGNASQHYATMTTEQIERLPIPQLMADKALAWIWCTVAFQDSAKQILRAWGFEPKSEVIWNKKRLGLGNYVRLQHECLLLGSKGGQRPLTHSLRSVVDHPRSKHSEKPAVFRTLVEANSGAPRLELFARGTHRGWTCFGNEPATK